MRNVQPKITHDNNKIYLEFTDSETSKLGITDFNEELWQIISTLKWRVKDSKYIYSGKRSLHRSVMEYWCGIDYCKKMDENDFVIDHFDNDGFNCLYENLGFLNRGKNWHYKGNYYDKKRVDAIPKAAINIFKKRGGDKFQITIGFNKIFMDSEGRKLSKAIFVYDTSDYDLVLSDAVTLAESVEKGAININILRYNRMKSEPLHSIRVDGLRPRTGSILNIDGKLAIVQGNDFPAIHKIAPDNTLW